jgi:hypothetical protein
MMNGVGQDQGTRRYQEPPPRLLALCNLIVSARTQPQIDAANDAARRHLQRYPEDQMIVMEVSERMAAIVDALRHQDKRRD